ncbi:MAG: polyprenol monophosphomannose synthase [Acidobacteria bacterium]|nr:polyprenol monophosphomannose synthase [Acidobacteriota bacterium]
MRPLVIVPTYNERDNIPIVVSRLMAIPDVRVLVVDDGSPDGTGAVADELAARAGGRVTVLHRTGRRGLGVAYIDGMRQALAGDATHICQMDADLSHDPSDVARLLAAAADADVVIGSRYVPGGRIENWPRRRRVLSAFANRYIRTITGLRMRDCTSGFRCWRREALERLPLERIASNGYAFLVELIWEAAASGCRVGEVPITFVERRQGASKLSGWVVIESAIVPWRLAWRSLSRRPFRATI